MSSVKNSRSIERPVAMVPAAGLGTRLHPYPLAKELFPLGFQDIEVDGVVQKRPKVISQYVLESLNRVNPHWIGVVLGEGKHDIMRFFGDGQRFGSRFIYFYQETPNGVPVALDLAFPLTGDRTVVFGMPDTVIEPADCFVSLLQHHHEQQADLTLGLFKTDQPAKFGMVEFSATDGRVVSTIDKPESTDLTYMWGNACWSPRFSALLHEYCQQHDGSARELVLGDVFNLAIETGLVVTALPFPEGRYLDIGSAEELDAAIKTFELR